MSEENYSYSVMAKKLRSSKGLVRSLYMDKALEEEFGGIFAKSKSAAIDAQSAVRLPSRLRLDRLSGSRTALCAS